MMYQKTTLLTVHLSVLNIVYFIFLGSAALNFAFVSAGNCDIYCHAGIRCWDMAAGALLVQEAGGVVLDPSGKGTNLRILKFYVVILDYFEQANLESD